MMPSHTDYPLLRQSLAPEYLELADEQLDALVAQIYGEGVNAEAIESFWRDVGRGFKQVGKSVGRALPAMAQGAMTGAGFGGPFGAIAGAVAGGAGGLMSQSRNPTLRGIGGAIGGVSQLASNFSPTGRLGGLASSALGALTGGGRGGRGGLGGLAQGALGALGGRGGAGGLGGLAQGARSALGGGAAGGSANALMGLLARPETMRALSSAALGSFGRSQVPVGAQQVPVQSILSALGGLAARAAGEAEAMVEQLPGYYYGADGELAIDPADAEQRTDALLELFVATPSPLLFEQEHDEGGEHDESDDSGDPWAYTAADARRDALLIATESQWYAEQELHHG